MTLDRLDTLSASCLSALGGPITANNLGKLRTWAHFEDGLSLSGGGLITCWNPWALEDRAYPNCPGKIVSAFPSCAAAVPAIIAAWNRDVPAIVANLRADGPWSAWLAQPILCQLGYWIHGVQCGGVYGGWGSVFEIATSGAPDPRWACPFPVTNPCTGVHCPAGQTCVGGVCVGTTPPPPVASSVLLPVLLAAAAAAGAWTWWRQPSDSGRGGAPGGPRSALAATPPRRSRPSRRRRGGPHSAVGGFS
jgi:hypothetical protein